MLENKTNISKKITQSEYLERLDKLIAKLKFATSRLKILLGIKIDSPNTSEEFTMELREILNVPQGLSDREFKEFILDVDTDLTREFFELSNASIDVTEDYRIRLLRRVNDLSISLKDYKEFLESDTFKQRIDRDMSNVLKRLDSHLIVVNTTLVNKFTKKEK